MLGELILSSNTYNVGRIALNEQFSGTAEFNNVSLDSGGNLSAGTGGGVIYSAGTDLYDIFTSAASDLTTASNGLTKTGNDITLGGTLSSNTSIITDSNDLLFDAGGGSGSLIMSGDSNFVNQFEIASYLIPSEPSSLQVGKGQARLYSYSGTSSSFISTSSSSIFFNRAVGALNQRIEFQETGGINVMLIRDDVNNKGVDYFDNYHANYDNRTLVDKEYVDNTSLSALTFQNGLIKTGSTVELGGQLSSDIKVELGHTLLFDAGSNNISKLQISGSSGSSDQIRLASYNSSTFPVFIDIGKGIAALYGLSGLTAQARVQVSSGSLKLEYLEGGTARRLTMDTDDFLIEDTLGGQGMLYAANYHSNYVNRSIVDKEYVDNHVGTGVTYIDEFVDFNPQTTLPSPVAGRVFFSGGSLNRLMQNTGGTASDWVII
jgi:hypothetical protein